MINLDKLEGAMIAAGFKTREQGAKSIGMPYATFCRKMRDGSFDCVDMQLMIDNWDIKQPEGIFFAPRIASEAI